MAKYDDDHDCIGKFLTSELRAGGGQRLLLAVAKKKKVKNSGGRYDIIIMWLCNKLRCLIPANIRLFRHSIVFKAFGFICHGNQTSVKSKKKKKFLKFQISIYLLQDLLYKMV